MEIAGCECRDVARGHDAVRRHCERRLETYNEWAYGDTYESDMKVGTLDEWDADIAEDRAEIPHPK